LRAKILPNIHMPHVDYVFWSLVTTFRRHLLPPIPVSTKEMVNSQRTTRFAKKVFLWSLRLVPDMSTRRDLVNLRPKSMRILGDRAALGQVFLRVILLPKISTIASIFYANVSRTYLLADCFWLFEEQPRFLTTMLQEHTVPEL
jgi:hypothetical protein